MSPALGPQVGFAATRIVWTGTQRRESSPARGSLSMRHQIEALMAVPAPRFAIAQNIGDASSPVCIWGELAAHIHLAADCHAGLTNGPIRDLPEMEALGFATFAAGADVGGGFVETDAMGEPISLNGHQIHQGDLIHADIHGAIVIPIEHATRLPDAVEAHAREERAIIAACCDKPLDLEALDQAWQARSRN
jgi:hypothetical protein